MIIKQGFSWSRTHLHVEFLGGNKGYKGFQFNEVLREKVKEQPTDRKMVWQETLNPVTPNFTNPQLLQMLLEAEVITDATLNITNAKKEIAIGTTLLVAKPTKKSKKDAVNL